MKCRGVYCYLLVMALALLVLSCGTSGTGARESETAYGSSSILVDNPSIDLTEYLRRIPGVQVTGQGASARVTIRGINTILGDPTPLFVIDGVRVGRNFDRVYTFVNMHNVTSIEVLKGPEASTYGVEGGNGVIIIHSRL